MEHRSEKETIVALVASFVAIAFIIFLILILH